MRAIGESDMRALAPIWCLLVITSLLATPIIETIRAAALENSTNNNDNNNQQQHLPDQHRSIISPVLPASTNSGPKKPATKQHVQSRKIILLATGDQIRLYPFTNSDHAGQQHNERPHETLSTNYYLLKPREPDVNSQNLELKLGRNSLTRWLTERAHTKVRNNESKTSEISSADSVSIIPNDPEDDLHYGGQSGWRRPLIVDVDYFFDASFCQLEAGDEDVRQQDCLVVVWLDNRNSFVRLGSFNLAQNPIEVANGSESEEAGNRVIWLDEFAPIDIKAQIPLAIAGSTKSLIVNKRRRRLHVMVDVPDTLPVRILTVDLCTARAQEEAKETQLRRQQVLATGVCSEMSIQHSNVDGIFVDEDNGDWLFYLEKSEDSKILALSIDKPWLGFYAKETRVDPTKLEWFEEFERFSRSKKRTPLMGAAKAMTLDPKRRRLYWLNAANEIISSDYAGNFAGPVQKLPSRPVIKSPSSMQILHDTLYISDSIKKSLVSYKLYTGTNNDDNGQLVEGQLPHQVLLVEMSAFYGFRCVELDTKISITEDETSGSVISWRQDEWMSDGDDSFGVNLAVQYLHSSRASEVYESLLERGCTASRSDSSLTDLKNPNYLSNWLPTLVEATYFATMIFLILLLLIVCIILFWAPYYLFEYLLSLPFAKASRWMLVKFSLGKSLATRRLAHLRDYTKHLNESSTFSNLKFKVKKQEKLPDSWA